MIKLAIGLVIAVLVGIGCRWFGLPLPGPPAIMGAAMAVAMAVGYTATDYLLIKRNPSTAAPVVQTALSPASSRQSSESRSLVSGSETS
jgi:XapX domain-containing protein